MYRFLYNMFFPFFKRYSKKMMLRIITEAAIKWIEVGLPLKVLKVVVYSRNPTLTGKDTLELVENFKDLKTNWMKIKDSESEFYKVITQNIFYFFLLSVYWLLLSAQRPLVKKRIDKKINTKRFSDSSKVYLQTCSHGCLQLPCINLYFYFVHLTFFNTLCLNGFNADLRIKCYQLYRVNRSCYKRLTAPPRRQEGFL